MDLVRDPYTYWKQYTHSVSEISPRYDIKVWNAIKLENPGDVKAGEFVGISALISDFAIEMGRPCIMLIYLVVTFSTAVEEMIGKWHTSQQNILSKRGGSLSQLSSNRSPRRDIGDAYHFG